MTRYLRSGLGACKDLSGPVAGSSGAKTSELVEMKRNSRPNSKFFVLYNPNMH